MKQYFLIALISSALFSCASQSPQKNTLRSSTNNANDFFIVDCLLPGQVRKLGQVATYITNRQPIKTTASDCEYRGGEYTAYNQANYGTALKIWLPRAKAGDAEAQAYVGEIYEKGAGLTADYNLAAQWYKKSAAQGNSRGQINLGYLYEHGLGVARDKAKAMEWYKKSSGLEKANIPYAATLTVGKNEPANYEVNLLKTNLKNSRNETQFLKKRLKKIQQRWQQSKQKNNRPILAMLEKRYQQQVKKLENKLTETQKRASQLIEQAKNHATKFSVSEGKLLESHAKLAIMEKDLLQFKKNMNSTPIETANKTQVSKLEKEKKALEAQIKNLQKQVQTQTASVKPTIEIIDPPFTLVRGKPTVLLRSTVNERKIVGKVTANSGLLSLLVNDKKNTVNAEGLFHSNVAIRNGETPVEVVAIDKKGGRSSLGFSFSSDSTKQISAKQTASSENTVDRSWQNLDFGNYYALIIGNNEYQKIPSLDTPITDAKVVEQILKQKYNFKTKLLINATRYEILSALNKLRGKLTENDNLLVYYAGHGELDKVNMRGHWLPVDADADNTANWVSTVAITDILNSMSVKHIMVVADSCYSGAMTRSSLARIDAGISSEKKSEWLKAMLKSKSRTVLTSGGLQPVMDGGGGDHSVFASAFINALKNNNSLLEGQALYRSVSSGIVEIAANYGIEQVPIYAPIRHAGHESGEFFFVPKI